MTQRNFQLSAESNPEYLWLSLTLLCDCSRKLTQSSRPIRCKTKNNRDLITCVLPRFKHFPCFHYEFSLANDNLNLCSDWSLGFFLVLKHPIKRRSKRANQSQMKVQCSPMSWGQISLSLLENVNSLSGCCSYEVVHLWKIILAFIGQVSLVYSCSLKKCAKQSL